MLDGRCNFLKTRAKQKDSEEPDFHALIVLDAKAGYFLIGLDAKWKYNKETGKLAEIAGSAEAFFDLNHPLNWHLYIGKRDPLEQRIRATFAGLFTANGYFMLDPHRLAVGVWIGKKDHYGFGPVSADLEAWLDANAALSFQPAQFHADLWLHGLLAVKVFKFRLGIGLDARLDADIFKPFHILGTLSIVISTRFKDFKFDVRLEWGPQPVRPEIPGAYKDAGIGHLKSTVEWALLEGAAAPTVPVDCRRRRCRGRPEPPHDLGEDAVRSDGRQRELESVDRGQRAGLPVPHRRRGEGLHRLGAVQCGHAGGIAVERSERAEDRGELGRRTASRRRPPAPRRRAAQRHPLSRTAKNSDGLRLCRGSVEQRHFHHRRDHEPGPWAGAPRRKMAVSHRHHA